jgi:sec-independent protein translocase protein TatC
MSYGSSVQKIRRKRYYVLVLAFILAALAEPADALAMSRAAVSLYLLFEIGLFCAGLLLRR